MHIKLIIDDTEVKTDEGSTVLEAALNAGIYIPALCYHPDLPPAPGLKSNEAVYRSSGVIKISTSDKNEYEGCKLCAVEIEGVQDLPLACATLAAEGMVVHTNTQQVKERRRDNLALILAKHPHACLLCAEREGCSREPCSLNVPLNERCCPKLGNCEPQRVAEYIGIKEATPRYIFRALPIIKDEPLFDRDYNLCIGCIRCVRICKELRGVEALGFVYHNGEVIAGTLATSLKDSECKFCGACVEVCPTGALTDKGITSTEREKQLVPCVYTCPIGIDVPRYIALIRERKFSEALAVIGEKTPIPSVLGYVCHHPCENNCRRGELNEPVAVCNLKRFVIDRVQKLGETKKKHVPLAGKRVAIVGSGPAGLTCAYYLAKLGHSVVVFEALSELGGMLSAAIPEYRLPKDVLRRDIAAILEQGVEFKTNTSIKDAAELEQLKSQGYHAIFLAIGAQLSKKLNIEGAGLDGVLWGVEFLKSVKLGHKVSLKDRIVVIGGGNVAIDAALTALRLGAKEVQVACLESKKELPAFKWEVQEAVDEGIIFNYSWGPKRILGNEKYVIGIELVRCASVFDKDGKFNPSFDETVTNVIEADTVIIAIGQAPDLALFGKDATIQATKAATILMNGVNEYTRSLRSKFRSIPVNDATLETATSGVFAGGDVVTGPASVVEATAMGRKAAIFMDKYLGGSGVIDEILAEREKPDQRLGKEAGFAEKRRVQMPCIPIDQRKNCFAEIELGLDETKAVEESKRCLRCDLRLQISQPVPPPEKWLEFNSKNVSLVPEKEGVYQLLDKRKIIIYIKGAANLRKDLEEQLKTNEKARYFGYEEDSMYTKRESELLQQFLQKHGRMPEGNEELEELF